MKKHNCKDFDNLEISDIKNTGLEHNELGFTCRIVQYTLKYILLFMFGSFGFLNMKHSNSVNTVQAFCP